MKIGLVLLNEFFATSGKSWIQRQRKGAYAPTTLITLASLIPEEVDADVVLIDEFVDVLNPETLDVDLVGLSFTTPNAHRAYYLSCIFKQRGITVVFGGYHTTLLPSEATKYADACVLGYAETSWPNLLRDYQRGKLQKVYTSWWADSYRTMKINTHHLIKRNKYILPDSVEFSRSCVNHCSFCVIPQVFGHQQVFRSIDVLVEEIMELDARNLVFLDSSPFEDLEMAWRLSEALMPLGIRWHSSITLKLMNEEKLIKNLSRSGCRSVLVGFESLNQAAINQSGKNFNKVQDYRRFIQLLHYNHISVLGSFMYGFDVDGPDIFQRTADFINTCHIDLVHHAVLTPFPGSTEFKRLDEEGRILSRDWSLYDSMHVVFEPAGMSSAQLQKGYWNAYKRTHSLRAIFSRMAHSPNVNFLNIGGNLAFRALGIIGMRKGKKGVHE